MSKMEQKQSSYERAMELMTPESFGVVAELQKQGVVPPTAVFRELYSGEWMLSWRRGKKQQVSLQLSYHVTVVKPDFSTRAFAYRDADKAVAYLQKQLLLLAAPKNTEAIDYKQVLEEIEPLHFKVVRGLREAGVREPSGAYLEYRDHCCLAWYGSNKERPLRLRFCPGLVEVVQPDYQEKRFDPDQTDQVVECIKDNLGEFQ